MPEGVVQLKSQIVQLVDHPVERRPVLSSNPELSLAPGLTKDVLVMLIGVPHTHIPMIVVIAEELTYLPARQRPQGLVGVTHGPDFMPSTSEAHFEDCIDGNTVAAEKVQPAPDRDPAPALLGAPLECIFDEESPIVPSRRDTLDAFSGSCRGGSSRAGHRAVRAFRRACCSISQRCSHWLTSKVSFSRPSSIAWWICSEGMP